MSRVPEPIPMSAPDITEADVRAERLPFHGNMTEEQVETVVKALRRACEA